MDSTLADYAKDSSLTEALRQERDLGHEGRDLYELQIGSRQKETTR